MSLHLAENIAQSLENQGKLAAQLPLTKPIDLSTYATHTLLKDVATCSHLHLDSSRIEIAESHNTANQNAATKLKLLPPAKVFGDTTTSQLSILSHLTKDKNDAQGQKNADAILEWAVNWTKELLASGGDLNQEEKQIIESEELLGGLKSEQGRRQLVVDVVTVRIGSLILPHLRPSGYMHCQTLPSLAYDINATVAHAKRLVLLARLQSPSVPSARVCIRIPCTLEGLKACNYLEKNGIRTLSTLCFSVEQGLACAEAAGATYVSPWVRSLSSHYEAPLPDNGYLHEVSEPGIALVRSLQVQLRRRSCRTRLMATSVLTSAEAMALCGIDNITIAPALLADLAVKPLTGTMREDRDKALDLLTVYDAEDDIDNADNEVYQNGEQRGPLTYDEEDVNDAGDGKGGWFDDQSMAGMKLKKAYETDRVKNMLEDALTIFGKAEGDLRDLVALKMVESGLEGMKV